MPGIELVLKLFSEQGFEEFEKCVQILCFRPDFFDALLEYLWVGFDKKLKNFGVDFINNMFIKAMENACQ